MIRTLQFAEILPFWCELWPNRLTPIETHSTMMLNLSRSIENFELPVWFYGLESDGIIVGVNSVHLCADGMARSRGLWVDEAQRRKGYGRLLLEHGVLLAKNAGASGIWSYSRAASWKTYEAIGFKLVSDWEESETSIANAYCSLYFNA